MGLVVAAAAVAAAAASSAHVSRGLSKYEQLLSHVVGPYTHGAIAPTEVGTVAGRLALRQAVAGHGDACLSRSGVVQWCW